MFKIKKTNKTLPGGGYVQIFFFPLCPLNPIVSWRAMNQTTWCSILLYHMPPSPNDHREFHILSVFSNLLPYPNSQCQQALARNTHTTLARETDRQSADFHLPPFSFKSNPQVSCPGLQPTNFWGLLCTPALISNGSHRCSFPKFSPPNHCFISSPNSSRESLGTLRLLQLGQQVG